MVGCMHELLLWLCSCLHVDPHVDPECSPGSRRQVAGAGAKLGQATIQLTKNKSMHTPLAHFHLLLFGCTLLIWHKAQPGWHDLALRESDSVAGRGCTKGNGKWRLQPRPSSSSSSIHNAATVPWKKICLLIGRARRALPLRHFGCTKVESKPGQASSPLYIRHIHVCTREVSQRCMYADTYEYVPYTRLLSLL